MGFKSRPRSKATRGKATQIQRWISDRDVERGDVLTGVGAHTDCLVVIVPRVSWATKMLDGPNNARFTGQQKRRAQLIRLLERTGGNVSQVARLMGKHRQQIHRWIRTYEIETSAVRWKSLKKLEA